MEDLQFIGVGGATCLELGGNCCFYKEENKLLIIDACECATKKLLEANAFKNVEEIFISITHTHFDHIAGLGVMIWYCKYYLNIIPKIVYANKTHLKKLQQLLKITGVIEGPYCFVNEKDFNLGGLKLKYLKTNHEPTLLCYGIMFKDASGKYYYSGDTNDISFIKFLLGDEGVKRVYCEVRSKPSINHIYYDELLKVKNNKIIPMHFNTIELYKRAKQDGFNMPKFVSDFNN